MLYSVHKEQFNCIGGRVLHSYIIVLLVLLAAIICAVASILYISMQGRWNRGYLKDLLLPYEPTKGRLSGMLLAGIE